MVEVDDGSFNFSGYQLNQFMKFMQVGFQEIVRRYVCVFGVG